MTYLMSVKRQFNAGDSMNNYVITAVCFATLFFLQVATGLAAQSSADVTVSPELLKEARKKVMGKAARSMKDNKEYVIGVGDIVAVTVYGEGTMSAAGATEASSSGGGDAISQGQIKVRIDGRISLSHIGDVQVAGMTMTQLADYLKELFQTAIDDPIVTTVLLQSNSRRYTVMGKVVRPGVYQIAYPITLVQAVASCGGFTEWANSNITVVRQKLTGDDEELSLFEGNILEFDYDDFLDGDDLKRNITLQSNDVIIVH